MTSKSMKGAPVRPQPLTDEEKAQQVARFLAQKREAFAQGILFNMVQGYHPAADDVEAMVNTAVSMADALMEKLYPVVKPEEKPAE